MWIVLGILLFVAAAGLSAYNYIDGMRAASASTKIAEALAERIVANAATAQGKWGASLGSGAAVPGAASSGGSLASGQAVSGPDGSAGTDQGKTGYARPASEDAISKYGTSVTVSTAAPYQEMPTEKIDGESYIGILEIPSLGLTLPVMENWNYERLKVSPCRYSGSYYANDLVICAHNYARHFSPIKWIGIGAEVYFTNVNGLRIGYKTSNILTLEPTSVDEMITNTSADAEGTKQWDLTLFTCNTGGQTRCAVRCVRMEDPMQGGKA